MRYSARLGELDRIRKELGETRYPEERAILTGTLLSTAGDVLRRTKALGGEAGGVVDAALKVLPREDVGAWLGSVKVEATKKAIGRALDEAFEIALSETSDERERHVAAALEGLSMRDRMESALWAVDRWQQVSGKLEGRSAERLESLRSELGKLDGQHRRGARSLIALNDVRRGERDMLDDGGRAAAWWYAARAECDELLGLFAGRGAKAAHCDDCARDGEGVAVVDEPPRRHPTSDELWSFDLGLMGERETAWVTDHAASCRACKQALKALGEGERAIEDELGERPSRAPSVEPKHGEEAVLEHAQFRAVLIRSGKRARVTIEPKGKAQLRGGSLLLGGSSESLKARRTGQGLEFNLSAVARKPAAQSARLSVELDNQKIELDWEI